MTLKITVTEDQISQIEKGDKAKAQDDDATVVISGAKKLKSGRNKILITVTSESGTVRTYRIYADVA